MPWWGILLVILTTICCGCLIGLVINKKVNNHILKLERDNLQKDIALLKQDKETKQSLLKQIEDSLAEDKQTLNEFLIQKQGLLTNIQDLTKIQKQTEDSLKNNVQRSFETYCDLLDKDLQAKENEYQSAAEQLQSAYDLAQQKLLNQLEEEKERLQRVRDTRAAAIQAQKREQEIKEQLSFYCLQPTQSELSDVKKLEAIKPQLNNPRILSMLIWSTYFQKPMTTLCNNILGTNIICGIYKITNQTNNMCYIGQSVDIAKRWKDHAKCGLGIDTPVGNKLYKAMIADGIWNFSFELLEKCPKELLNEKEKYYIDLYSSKDYGYNISKGIGD